MPRFALKEVDNIKGPIKFFKLEIDGRCEVDEFLETLERNGRKKDVKKLTALMDMLSNRVNLPPTKHKHLQGVDDENDVFEEWEIKHDEIRLYYFNFEKDKIIVFGARKNKIKAQRKDVKRLRSIKNEYLKSRASKPVKSL